MNNQILSLLSGDVLEEDVELTLAELCKACQLPAEQIYDFVEQGLVEPSATGTSPGQWRFQGVSVFRVKRALRLQHDLGVNIAGAALALDLMEELDKLHLRLQQLESTRW